MEYPILKVIFLIKHFKFILKFQLKKILQHLTILIKGFSATLKNSRIPILNLPVLIYFHHTPRI